MSTFETVILTEHRVILSLLFLLSRQEPRKYNDIVIVWNLVGFRLEHFYCFIADFKTKVYIFI